MSKEQFYPMRGADFLVNGLKNLINNVEEKIGDLKTKSLLEIGSYVGESTIIFAEKFGKVVAIDPFMNDYDPNDIACSFAEFSNVKQQFLLNTDSFKNISLIQSTSDSAFETELLKKTFDFVYIDGMHTYEQVCKDIEGSLKVLKSNNGIKIIGGHDYSDSWQGVVNAVNEKIGQPDFVFEDTSWLKIIQ
jgi:hypothetical protein